MERLISHTNMIIICVCVIGLGTYLYARIIQRQQYEYLLIIFIISICGFQRIVTHIKVQFCIVATLAVMATFIKHPKVDLIILSVAFPLAVNLGYMLINRCRDEIQLKIYESFLNLSFTLSVFSSLLCYYAEISRITLKIIILVTTLPCCYLSLPQSDQPEETARDSQKSEENLIESRLDLNLKIKNKLVCYLNPLFCKTWIYALGYSFGIYLNIFQVFSVVTGTKHIKYLIIALLILIETLTYRELIKWFCMFIRALLVFHYERINHNYENYFIFVYVFLKNFLPDDAINIYLMFGYVVISIIVWREEYQINYVELRSSKSDKKLSEALLTSERDRSTYDRQFQMPSCYQLKEQQSGRHLTFRTQTNISP